MTGNIPPVITDRNDLARIFLMTRGQGQAKRESLADDASFRRYERLILGDKKAVFMDAPPHFEDVRPFLAVAQYLRGLGLAAPEIMACDIKNGFLLLEDMGNDLFAGILSRDPARENDLYRLGVDGLIELHKSCPPSTLPVAGARPHTLPRYDRALLLQELGLFTDWYIPALGSAPLPEAARQEFFALWHDILTPVVADLNCLCLRDYHAENLMLRAGKDDQGAQSGLARLGLLDFQDAVIGHPAYDLMSLLQDARREVSPDLEQDMISYYLDISCPEDSGYDRTTFIRDYAILGAQRAAKIIGIFTRLYLRDGKDGYLDKIPAVWAMLCRNLDHPVLRPVKNWLDRHIPPEIRQQAFVPKAFMPDRAMILAAGLGKRMRPLSDHCPKPLISVAGKELLSWSLAALSAAGVRHAVINTHYLADRISDFIDNYHDHRLALALSDERAELLDSGGGVKQALEYLGDDPFLVLNSDMIWRDGDRQILHRMQAFWQQDDMDILMLLIARDKAVGYDAAGDYHLGDLGGDNAGRLTARGKDDEADYVYGGIMIMTPELFKNTPDGPFSLRLLFDRAEKQGRLYGMVHDGEWYHVGTPRMRDKVEDILNKCQGG